MKKIDELNYYSARINSLVHELAIERFNSERYRKCSAHHAERAAALKAELDVVRETGFLVFLEVWTQTPHSRIFKVLRGKHD